MKLPPVPVPLQQGLQVRLEPRLQKKVPQHRYRLVPLLNREPLPQPRQLQLLLVRPQQEKVKARAQLVKPVRPQLQVVLLQPRHRVLLRPLLQLVLVPVKLSRQEGLKVQPLPQSLLLPVKAVPDRHPRPLHRLQLLRVPAKVPRQHAALLWHHLKPAVVQNLLALPLAKQQLRQELQAQQPLLRSPLLLAKQPQQLLLHQLLLVQLPHHRHRHHHQQQQAQRPHQLRLLGKILALPVLEHQQKFKVRLPRLHQLLVRRLVPLQQRKVRQQLDAPPLHRALLPQLWLVLVPVRELLRQVVRPPQLHQLQPQRLKVLANLPPQQRVLLHLFIQAHLQRLPELSVKVRRQGQLLVKTQRRRQQQQQKFPVQRPREPLFPKLVKANPLQRLQQRPPLVALPQHQPPPPRQQKQQPEPLRNLRQLLVNLHHHRAVLLQSRLQRNQQVELQQRQQHNQVLLQFSTQLHHQVPNEQLLGHGGDELQPFHRQNGQVRLFQMFPIRNLNDTVCHALIDEIIKIYMRIPTIVTLTFNVSIPVKQRRSQLFANVPMELSGEKKFFNVCQKAQRLVSICVGMTQQLLTVVTKILTIVDDSTCVPTQLLIPNVVQLEVALRNPSACVSPIAPAIQPFATILQRLRSNKCKLTAIIVSMSIKMSFESLQKVIRSLKWWMKAIPTDLVTMKANVPPGRYLTSGHVVVKLQPNGGKMSSQMTLPNAFSTCHLTMDYKNSRAACSKLILMEMFDMFQITRPLVQEVQSFLRVAVLKFLVLKLSIFKVLALSVYSLGEMMRFLF